MKLYMGLLSLFSRKTEIALCEKGLSFERIIVPFSQTEGYYPKHPDVLAANPKGQVPVLADGDLTLYDSTVILEYLEDSYPAPSLYPASASERARCRLFDVFADEIMLVSLRPLMARTEPGRKDATRRAQEEARAREGEAVLAGHYAYLERALSDRIFLCDTFSVADIAVFMTVLWSRRLGGPALTPYPALGTWYARLMERPAFATVAQSIIEADRALSAPVEGAYRT